MKDAKKFYLMILVCNWIIFKFTIIFFELILKKCWEIYVKLNFIKRKQIDIMNAMFGFYTFFINHFSTAHKFVNAILIQDWDVLWALVRLWVAVALCPPARLMHYFPETAILIYLQLKTNAVQWLSFELITFKTVHFLYKSFCGNYEHIHTETIIK